MRVRDAFALFWLGCAVENLSIHFGFHSADSPIAEVIMFVGVVGGTYGIAALYDRFEIRRRA